MCPVPQCQRVGSTSQTWKVCLVRPPNSLTQMPTRAKATWGESALREYVENPKKYYHGTKVISAETKGERSYLITSQKSYLWVMIGLYHIYYETVTFFTDAIFKLFSYRRIQIMDSDKKYSCNTVLIKIRWNWGWKIMLCFLCFDSNSTSVSAIPSFPL